MRRFVELFVAAKIPVSYQIIPERFTTDCAEYLLGVEADHPNLIEFGQHGLRHSMTLGSKVLKREFGPERSLADQRKDIAQGKAILTRMLGRDITLFTPPQHKFDRNTLLALDQSGHRILSAAYYPTRHHQLIYAIGRRLGLTSLRHHGISYHGGPRPEGDLRECSISVAVDDGKVVTCPAKDLAAAVRAGGSVSHLVGFMFHHEVYAPPELRSELSRIVEHLGTYANSDFHKIGDLDLT